MTPPGWYADPVAASLARYWDGAAWTDQTTPLSASVAESAAPTTPIPTGPSSASPGHRAGPGRVRRRLAAILAEVASLLLVGWLWFNSGAEALVDAVLPLLVLGLVVTDRSYG